MLTRLTARGYKSLREVNMPGLTQFVTVVGPNNSGKSALAELVLAIGNVRPLGVASADLERVRNNGQLEAFSRPDARFRIDGHFETWDYSVRFARQGGGRFELESPKDATVELLQRQFLHMRYFGPFEQLGKDNPTSTSLTLDRYGGSLTSTLFFTSVNFRETFQEILTSFRRVFPELPDILPKMRDANTVHAEIQTGPCRGCRRSPGNRR